MMTQNSSDNPPAVTSTHRGSSYALSMSSAYYFLDDLAAFQAYLQSRGYKPATAVPEDHEWVVYSKVLSDAVIKYYAYPFHPAPAPTHSIRVTYELVNQGKPLFKLVKVLKALNLRYRMTQPGWKTKRRAPKEVRHRRWMEIQQFLQKHRELIDCFRYRTDDPVAEGNYWFNFQITASPRERAICLDFIKALVEAYSPEGIVRGHRQADQSKVRRNGWIRRYASLHRRRGWASREIVHEIQRELREGTWNRRSKSQYNLSLNTIGKIAGLRLPSGHSL